MAWIDEIEEADATGELGQIYAGLVEQRGKLSNIMKVQSLNPGAMQKHLDLYMQLMFAKSGLSRADREAIAVAVSAANNCAYCVSHHAEALQRYEKDKSVLREIRNLHFIELPERLARMLSYAVKLTREPARIREEELDLLREAGLSDSDILDINLVTAYFNFVNRIALGLGVTFSAEETAGYKA
ncbi:MAG: peroxidase-related enzyme [Gammaproteobacteria bacterium]|nr:peroxidase-related enzyme [Gammaproteobacteria bacterium]